MHTDSLLIIGASGHAKVVLDALRASEPALMIGVTDDNRALEGTLLHGLPVLTPVDWTREPTAAPFHIAIGHNENRARCYTAGRASQRMPRSIIHPDATVSPLAEIGAGSFVAARAVVAPAARVGEGVILNHGSVVDHDCLVGDFSHIAPLAVLGGGVNVGRLVLIGAGAIVLPGQTIGDRAIIGAGAVVTRDVAAGVTVMGIPARTTHSHA